MKTLRREVLDALEDAPNGLCDACLQKALGASSHQHVNATCRNLEIEGRLGRSKSAQEECDGCLKIRVINRLVPSVQRAQPAPKAQKAPGGNSIGINELDDLRREIIQFLNKIDPGSAKDGFGKRVSALRSNQLLPPLIASLMLTHAAYRNELYYTSYQLTGDEMLILESIDKFLRSFLASAKP
jgi:hypothetical protein